LVGFTCATGLGNTARDFFAHLPFDRWLVLNHPRFGLDRTGLDDRCQLGALDMPRVAVAAWLDGREVIAVDQDPLGEQGHLAASPGTNLQVWSKTLSGTNVRAVALLNRGTATASITVQWSAIGIPTGAATVPISKVSADIAATAPRAEKEPA
jgi:hypothetical protein